MMAKRKEASHLRLIVDQEKGEKPVNVCWEPPQQISLPYPDGVEVILALVATMSLREFVELVIKTAPSWMIDVRVAPRFDTLACSREVAFRLFQEKKATYVDLFGRLGVKSYRRAESNPAFWGDGLCNLLTKSERRGPYVLLFDDHDLMVNAGNVLPRMIRRALGEEVHFRRIKSHRNIAPQAPWEDITDSP